MKNILIVGLGLIGGNYAYKLSKKGYLVNGIDVDYKAVEYAKNKKYIDDNKLSDIEKIKQADLIILTLYPKDILSFIDNYSNYFQKGTVITDVAGVKLPWLKEIDKHLPSYCSYISHHPMAGKEKQGIKYSEEVITENANFIIIGDENDQKCETIVSLGKELGFKNIAFLDAEKHDEFIGYLSQLPHAIAMALMNAKDLDKLISYSGDSFRDLTRIAKMNDALWTELFIQNKDVLVKEIDEFIKSLDNIKKSILYEDKEKLSNLMKESTKRRERFEK